jgi:putative transcriptional regulator
LQNVVGLLKASVMPEGALHVFGKLYLISTRLLLEKTLAERSGPGEFRVYLGYCGWGPGQLENEIRQRVWHVFAGNVAGNQDLVFDSEPDTLWSRLIARVGQRIARARVPMSIGFALRFSPEKSGWARLQ